MKSKINSNQGNYLDNLSEDILTAVKWGMPLGLTASLIIFGISYGIVRKLYSTPKEISPIEQRVNIKDIRVYQRGKGRDIVKYLDKEPFGSLDEVVKIENERPITLKVGERSFNQYIQEWEADIKPKYHRK